jgi:hypothetical protein
MILFGTHFKAEIPWRKHWLSTWPMTLQSKGLVGHMGGSRMDGESGADVCGVRPGKKLSFSLGVYATVFQADIFMILACTKEHTGRAYTAKHIYKCSVRQLCVTSRHGGNVKACLGVSTGLCALSRSNKVTGPLVTVGFRVARKWMPWLGTDWVVYFSVPTQQFGYHLVLVWLGLRRGVPDIELPYQVWGSQSSSLESLINCLKYLMALDRKQCRLVTGLLIDCCTLCATKIKAWNFVSPKPEVM